MTDEITKVERYEAMYMAQFKAHVADCEVALQKAKDRLAEAERRQAAGLLVIEFKL